MPRSSSRSVRAAHGWPPGGDAGCEPPAAASRRGSQPAVSALSPQPVTGPSTSRSANSAPIERPLGSPRCAYPGVRQANVETERQRVARPCSPGLGWAGFRRSPARPLADGRHRDASFRSRAPRSVPADARTRPRAAGSRPRARAAVGSRTLGPRTVTIACARAGADVRRVPTASSKMGGPVCRCSRRTTMPTPT